MKILYDYQAFAMQPYGGVSRSFAQLIGHLPAGVDYEIAINHCRNEHLHESGIAPQVARQRYPFPRLMGRGWGRKTAKAYNHFLERLPGQWASVRALRMGEFDVFHPTFYHDYFLRYLGGKPFVLTVHDLTYEVLSDMVRPRRNDNQVAMRARLCPLAARVIAVSENTANDVSRFYHVPESKITVIYHGAPTMNVRRSLTPVVDFKYILYVGSRNGYKNFTWMLQSLSAWLKDGDIKLVCTGPDWSAGELEQLRSLGVQDQVVHLHATSDELYRLYNHAEAFIYPSLYEGFGIPILEAMAGGCPVLLSRASCFPEIAGDAARYFDVDDANGLVAQVQAITGDPALQASLTAAGYRRLQDFSWQKSARQLTAVYQTLI